MKKPVADAKNDANDIKLVIDAHKNVLKERVISESPALPAIDQEAVTSTPNIISSVPVETQKKTPPIVAPKISKRSGEAKIWR